MQELLKATQSLQESLKRLQKLKLLIHQHIQAPQRLAATVSAMRAAAQQHVAHKIQDHATIAMQAFIVLRNQADALTAAATSRAFASVVQLACSEKEAAKQAVLSTNSAIYAQCMAYKLAKTTIRGHISRVGERQRAAKAIVDISMMSMNSYVALQQTFQDNIQLQVQTHQDFGRRECVCEHRSHIQASLAVSDFWYHQIQSLQQLQACAACIVSAKQAYQAHAMSARTISEKCEAAIAYSTSIGVTACSQCMKAAAVSTSAHNRVQSTFKKVNAVHITETSAACFQRRATSVKSGTSKAGNRATKKDPVMEMLAAAIQKRIVVPQQKTESTSQVAEWSSPQASNFCASSSHAPARTQRASMPPVIEAAMSDYDVGARRSSRPAVLQNQKYIQKVEDLDMEADDLGDRLQVIPAIARQRAARFAAPVASTLDEDTEFARPSTARITDTARSIAKAALKKSAPPDNDDESEEGTSTPAL